MAIVNLKTLIQKLGTYCERSLETAVGMCLSRSHYTVEIAHWLIKLVEIPDGDLTLAEQLYSGEQNLTTINLSEFKEEHKVSLAEQCLAALAIGKGVHNIHVSTKSGEFYCAID